MKQSKYIVKLTDEERAKLNEILNKGSHPAQQVKRVRILIALDKFSHFQNGSKRKNMPTLEKIAGECGADLSTIYNVSKQYVEEGLDAVITKKKRETPPITPIVTGDIEARIVTLACGTPPEGYSQWTLRLLESKVVELGIIDKISDTTIYRTLKKQNSNHT